MTARLLDGRAPAASLRELFKARTHALQTSGVCPRLQIVQIGGDSATTIYASRLTKTANSVGVASATMNVDETISDEELRGLVQQINSDSSIDGAIFGMPLPKHLSLKSISDHLDPNKDADGITTQNAGRLYLGQPCHVPSTAASILHLLAVHDVSLSDKHAVVVGRSPVVGKPAAILCLQQHATVTICHSRTTNLAEIIATADVVIAAVGVPELIRGSMLKPGSVVIDAGINPTDEGLKGDVAFDEACSVASAISPVPGGVGPLTNVMLIGQVISQAETQVWALGSGSPA